MRLLYSFRRDHPFGADATTELVKRYCLAVADALRDRYPGWDVAVEELDSGITDVVFDPKDAITPDERLRIAVDVKHVAHRIAERMFAESVSDS